MTYQVLIYPIGEKPNILDSVYLKLQKSARAKINRQLGYLEEYGLTTSVINLKKIQGYPFWEARILGKENIRLMLWGIQRYIFILHIFQKKEQLTKLKDLKITEKRLNELKSSLNI